MGLLFENMQKMDIQAERKNTEEARKQVADARQRYVEERELREGAEKQVVETIVVLCQKHGDTKQEAVMTLMKMREIAQVEAEEAVEFYWK